MTIDWRLGAKVSKKRQHYCYRNQVRTCAGGERREIGWMMAWTKTIKLCQNFHPSSAVRPYSRCTRCEVVVDVSRHPSLALFTPVSSSETIISTASFWVKQTLAPFAFSSTLFTPWRDLWEEVVFFLCFIHEYTQYWPSPQSVRLGAGQGMHVLSCGPA